MTQRLPVASCDLGALEERYVLEAVRSGWISSIGAFVDRFERDFARFCQVEHAVAVSNGTDALFIALRALGVTSGDEVIVPALTFAAVAAVVVHCGAQPVFCDVEPRSWCIDPRAVERAVSPRTRAVIAVHSYGHPADMDALLEITRPRGIRLIEDCAEAHGARLGGRVVGAIGDVGCFSFYGNKIITTGEGGMITTRDGALAPRARYLTPHAMDPARRYWHTEAGHNCRMTNVQAALGCAQLERVNELLATKRATLEAYRAGLTSTSFQLNPHLDGADPVVWMVCALASGDVSRRDRLCDELRAQAIDTRPFFVPLPQLPPYAGAPVFAAAGAGASPVADRLGATGFNLPSGYGLGAADIERVTTLLRALDERDAPR